MFSFLIRNILLALPLISNGIRFAYPVRLGHVRTPWRRLLFTILAFGIGVTKMILYGFFSIGTIPPATYCLQSQALQTILPFLNLLLISESFLDFSYNFCIYWLTDSFLGTLPSVIIMPRYIGLWQGSFSLGYTAWISLLCLGLNVGGFLLNILLIRIIIRWISEKSLKLQERIGIAGLTIHILMTVMSFFSTLQMGTDIVTNRIFLMLIMLTALMVLSLVLTLYFYMSETNTQLSLHRATSSLLELQLTQQAIHRERLSSFLAIVDRNLDNISQYLQKDEIEQAEQRLRELTNQNQRMVQRYADHPIADAALSTCAYFCEQHGIRWSVSGILPAELPIAELQQTGLFYNLINNACENAAQSGASEPFVDLRFQYLAGALIIRSKNSTNTLVKPRRISERFLSTKTEEGHGYGTRILSQIVHDLDGTYSLEFNDAEKTATATVMIPLKEQ